MNRAEPELPGSESERLNNLMATGALFAAAHSAGLQPQLVVPPTNAFTIALHGFTSRYRITVEQVPTDELTDDELLTRPSRRW